MEYGLSTALCVKAKDAEGKYAQMQEMIAGLLKRNGCPGAEQAYMDCFRIIGAKNANRLDVGKFTSDFNAADADTPFDCRSYYSANIAKIEDKEQFKLMCTVCPLCEEGKMNQRQLSLECSILAYICHLPYEKGVKYLGHGEVFVSYDELNGRVNLTMEKNCIFQFPSMIVGLLSEQDYALYKELVEVTEDENAYKGVVDKIVRKICVDCKEKMAVDKDIYSVSLSNYFYDFYFSRTLIKEGMDSLVESFFAEVVEEEEIYEEDDFLSELGIGDIDVFGEDLDIPKAILMTN